jgi:hypothetical protein
MKKSVIPKKFGASFSEHFRILKTFFQVIHSKEVLEIATGSGNVVNSFRPTTAIQVLIFVLLPSRMERFV